jgi:hypothetical protein
VKRTPIRKKPIHRDWRDSDHKRGPCVVCMGGDTQLHHTVGRRYDKKITSTRYWVDPDSVVSRCTTCHNLVHAHKLLLTAYLSDEEWRYVRDLCLEHGLNPHLKLGGTR